MKMTKKPRQIASEIRNGDQNPEIRNGDQKPEIRNGDQKPEIRNGDQKPEVRKRPDRYHQPSVRECALLVLRLLKARTKELDREISRARISQSTLRRLFGRSQITNDLLLDVQEILLAAGWCLFCAGPTHFAIIKKQAVEGWARISSGRIKNDLANVSKGQYDFEPLERLLTHEDEAETEDGDE
jgi:hypothetical protein